MPASAGCSGWATNPTSTGASRRCGLDSSPETACAIDATWSVRSPTTIGCRTALARWAVVIGRSSTARCSYRVQDDDLFLDLTVDDFYPRTDFFPSDAGTVSQDFASAHYECSGSITGEVRLAGRNYEIDGLCHRDHSWGTRRWDTLLNHRWMPGRSGQSCRSGRSHGTAWTGR